MAKSLKAGNETPTALTVDGALDKYFKPRAAEGMKSIDDAKTRAAFYIRPKLGGAKLSDLTIEKIRFWRDGWSPRRSAS